MKNKLVIPVVALFALAVAIPAFAGGGQCSSKTAAAAMSAGSGSCSSKGSMAWAGAWLQRSQNGSVVVTEVATNSPASRSGLRAGDVVLAVNGNKLSSRTTKNGEMCPSGTACNVGSSFAYQVKRGRDTKTVKMTLEPMPADASERFAAREASFDRSLAAVVIPGRD